MCYLQWAYNWNQTGPVTCSVGSEAWVGLGPVLSHASYYCRFERAEDGLFLLLSSFLAGLMCKPVFLRPLSVDLYRRPQSITTWPFRLTQDMAMWHLLLIVNLIRCTSRKNIVLVPLAFQGNWMLCLAKANGWTGAESWGSEGVNSGLSQDYVFHSLLLHQI